MKQCPQCNRTYRDDALDFCLDDGTSLVPVYGIDEEPTVVRAENMSAAPVTVVTGKRSGSWVKILALALAAIVLIAVVALAGLWMLLKRSEVAGTANTNTDRTPAPAATPVSGARPSPSPAPSRPAAANSVNTTNANNSPAPADPGVTRINFQTGAMGQAVSSMVTKERVYALRTMDGQTLTASLSSTGGCVTFSDGGTSTGYTTSRGDSFLKIRNKCPAPTRFTMNVSVR